MWIFKKRHNCLAIANMYIARARDERIMLPLGALNSYVYLANAWNLAYEDRPLIKEDVIVGKNRPIIKEIIRRFGGQKISITAQAAEYHPEFGRLPPYSTKLSSAQADIMDKVFTRYQKYSEKELREIICWRGSPWERNRNDINKILSPKSIKAYYRKMIEAPVQSTL